MVQQNCRIRVRIANVYLEYVLRYPETKKYFKNFICTGTPQAASGLLTVTDELWERHKNVAESSSSKAYTEFYALLGITSRALLKNGKCLSTAAHSYGMTESGSSLRPVERERPLSFGCDRNCLERRFN